jgi:hypothetical protein
MPEGQLAEPPEDGLAGRPISRTPARAHQFGLHELRTTARKAWVLGCRTPRHPPCLRLSRPAPAACAIVQDGECSTRAAGRGGRFVPSGRGHGRDLTEKPVMCERRPPDAARRRRCRPRRRRRPVPSPTRSEPGRDVDAAGPIERWPGEPVPPPPFPEGRTPSASSIGSTWRPSAAQARARPGAPRPSRSTRQVRVHRRHDIARVSSPCAAVCSVCIHLRLARPINYARGNAPTPQM